MNDCLRLEIGPKDDVNEADHARQFQSSGVLPIPRLHSSAKPTEKKSMLSCPWTLFLASAVPCLTFSPSFSFFEMVRWKTFLL